MKELCQLFMPLPQTRIPRWSRRLALALLARPVVSVVGGSGDREDEKEVKVKNGSRVERVERVDFNAEAQERRAI